MIEGRHPHHSGLPEAWDPVFAISPRCSVTRARSRAVDETGATVGGNKIDKVGGHRGGAASFSAARWRIRSPPASCRSGNGGKAAAYHRAASLRWKRLDEMEIACHAILPASRVILVDEPGSPTEAAPRRRGQADAPESAANVVALLIIDLDLGGPEIGPGRTVRER